MDKKDFMREAIALSINNIQSGGGPFGAVIVKNGEIVSRAVNNVTKTNDPTAHAEVNAIRDACSKLETFKLEGCELYTSCEPCPMCLSSAYWAGIKTIYYGNSKSDAKKINFDDSFIYDQIPLAPDKRTIPSKQLLNSEAIEAFEIWDNYQDKIIY